MMNAPFVKSPECRQGGLSQAYAAVVRGHQPMAEDAEAALLEPPPDRIEQPKVLERPAGEDDCSRTAGLRAGVRGRGGDGLMEPCGDLFSRAPGPALQVTDCY